MFEYMTAQENEMLKNLLTLEEKKQKIDQFLTFRFYHI